MTKVTWIKWGLILTLFLSLQPLKMPWLGWLPKFECLLVLFWALQYPKSVHLGFIFAVGFLMDLLQNGLLGVHALGLVFITSAAYALRFRFAFYPLWQQSALIGIFTLVYLNLLYWIHHLSFETIVSWHFWAASLTTAMSWPILLRLNGKHITRSTFSS